MSAATVLKSIYRVASMFNNIGKKEDGSKLGIILITTIGGAFGAIVLLIAAATTIITSPFPWANIQLQQFQADYSYLFAGDTEFLETGGYTQLEIQSMVAQLGDIGDERKAILEQALSLVGRVSYFWGGKSDAIGWDERWGTPTLVSAAGSSTTGTVIPFGLDCTGYVDWVMNNAGVETYPALYAYYRGEKITKDELIPGDLVFVKNNSTGGISHIGIYYGQDEDGNRLYLHCSFSGGGVVLNSYSGFTLFARLHLGGD